MRKTGCFVLSRAVPRREKRVHVGTNSGGAAIESKSIHEPESTSIRHDSSGLMRGMRVDSAGVAGTGQMLSNNADLLVVA